MHKKPHVSHALVEPQQALSLYLDALLNETTFAVVEDKQERYVTENTVLEKVLERTTALEAELESVDIEPVPLADTPQKRTCIETPDWAQNRFQCLSFQVAGVTLAAPLEKLNGIVEISDEITALPGYAPWVIGLLPNRGQNVQVVDVAQIIMPNESDLVMQPTVERMKFIILLDGGKFGLAADSLSQVLNLETDDVRWRSTQSKRPWLAGTVIAKMCALLEMDLLCEQLRAGLTGR